MIDPPLDAIVTLLLFAIGVPTLVAQSLDPEIRRVLYRRLIIFPAIMIGGIVCLGGGIVGIGLQQPDRWNWGATIEVLFFATLFITVFIPYRYGRRDAIVQSIRNDAARKIKQARLEERPLEDLINLGVESSPGQDKESVLRALQFLTNAVCRQLAYRGDSLEELIQGLVKILTYGPGPKSPQNFQTAADILQEIVMAFTTSDQTKFRQVDLLLAVRALSELGQAALALDHLPTQMKFVQALGSTGTRHRSIAPAVSQALSEVGIAAIEHHQMLAAIASLDKLSTLTEAYQPSNGELAADVLGLLAYFWTDGPSTRVSATTRLRKIAPCLSKPLPEALAGAHYQCTQTMQFVTADRLLQMAAEYDQVLVGPD